METTTERQSAEMRPKDFDYYCLFCIEPFNVEENKVTDSGMLHISFGQSYGRQLQRIFEGRLCRYEKLLPSLRARYVNEYDKRTVDRINWLFWKGNHIDEATVVADQMVAREMTECRPKTVEELARYYDTAYKHLTFERLEDFCKTVDVMPAGPKAHAECLDKKLRKNIHQQRSLQMTGIMGIPALDVLASLEGSPTFGWYANAFKDQYQLLEDRVVTLKVTQNGTGH